jgi:hypothetical protein
MKKHLVDLTINDLLANPVWKHWYENGIEFIEPSTLKEISENDDSYYVVLTEFLANNGRKYFGFCSPQDLSGLDYIQPVIISELGQVDLYTESPTHKYETFVLSKLRINKSDLFPLRYITKVKCDNQYIENSLLDFNKENK